MSVEVKAPPSLRKPGFVFMELATKKVDEYETFFGSVAGFQVVYRKPGYIQAQSEHAELTFIDPAYWGPGHPFHGKVTGSGMGVGIEIGIVVADIEKAHAAAVKFKDKGWPITTGIVMRPWGVRDFRVMTPDGYYLRFTEGR
jgi:lactoylglutathione lyase